MMVKSEKFEGVANWIYFLCVTSFAWLERRKKLEHCASLQNNTLYKLHEGKIPNYVALEGKA